MGCGRVGVCISGLWVGEVGSCTAGLWVGLVGPVRVLARLVRERGCGLELSTMRQLQTKEGYDASTGHVLGSYRRCVQQVKQSPSP